MITEYLYQTLSICASEFEVTIDDVKSKKRKRKLVYCRKAYTIIIKERLDLNLEDIATSINRTISAISSYICNQPKDNYYLICIRQCRKAVQEKFK